MLEAGAVIIRHWTFMYNLFGTHRVLLACNHCNGLDYYIDRTYISIRINFVHVTGRSYIQVAVLFIQ
jgi:hypothetical protein